MEVSSESGKSIRILLNISIYEVSTFFILVSRVYTYKLNELTGHQYAIRPIVFKWALTHVFTAFQSYVNSHSGVKLNFACINNIVIHVA